MEVLSCYAYFEKCVAPNQAPVAAGTIISSRLMPTTLFETPAGRPQIVAYFKYVADLV
jgi:hypothetical protein